MEKRLLPGEHKANENSLYKFGMNYQEQRQSEYLKAIYNIRGK